MRTAVALVVFLPACSLLTPLDGFSEVSAPVPDAALASEDGGIDADGAPPSGDGAAPSAYAAAVMADAPLAYLRFGEAAPPAARDETGRMTGTYSLVGVKLGAPGALSNDPDTAVELDGSGQITMPPGAEFAGNAPYTVEIWVKQALSSSPIAFLVDHESWSGERRGWMLGAGTVQLFVERYASSTANHSRSVQPLDTEWHHVAAVYDGARHLVYVDGALGVVSDALALAIPAISMPWSIGHQNCACTGNSFVGILDELAIYDKALPASRVAAHFKASGR